MEMVFYSLLFFFHVVSVISPPLTKNEKKESDRNIAVTNSNDVYQNHQKRVGFQEVYVDRVVFGFHYTKPNTPSIRIRATTRVSDLAIRKAATVVGLMIKNVPHDVFLGVTKSHGLGIFTKSDTLTVSPEKQHLRDTPQCRGKCSGECVHTCTSDGRKYAEIAGDADVLATILDDNLLCNDKDPYGHKENILVHEFGHLVMKFMPSHYRDKVYAAYHIAKTHTIWYNSYAMSNADEYWAEAISSFFMTIFRGRTSGPTGGMNLCDHFSRLCNNEMEVRRHIQQRDPMLYDVLKQVYTNNQDHLPSGLKVCQ